MNMNLKTGAEFNGSDYIPTIDKARLTGQILRVYELMKDGEFRTLSQIAAGTGDPESSVSAQLRHLRKEKFGSHIVNKNRIGLRENGLFHYQLVINDTPEQLTLV